MSKLHISTDGGQPVQYDEAKAKSMLEDGLLHEDTLYWKEGMKDWEPLRSLFPPSPYAPPASDPVAPPPLREQGTGFAFTKNPLGATRFLKVMLWIHLGTVLLVLLGDLGQLMITSTGTITVEAAETNDARQGVIGLLYTVVYIATTIVFGRWIYLANVNCRGFGAASMQFTPGWAVGSYFVPILNLFRPYQAMKEIWQASSNPRHWHTEKAPGILPTWWTLWLVSNLFGQIIFRTSMAADTAEELHRVTVISMMGSLVDIALVLVAIALVSKITAMQLRLTTQTA